MVSYVTQNARRLASRHYVRNATAWNHWFDFTDARLQSYLRRYGEGFCLVINGSHDRDDAYVLPYRVAKQILTRDRIDYRGRWVGTIVGDKLRVAGDELNLPVVTFRNAFHLL